VGRRRHCSSELAVLDWDQEKAAPSGDLGGLREKIGRDIAAAVANIFAALELEEKSGGRGALEGRGAAPAVP
jgi:hypothetical protein